VGPLRRALVVVSANPVRVLPRNES
jgi:hypothetical protein